MPEIEAPGRDARALIHDLMSPYCPGLLLSDCRSEGARTLRAEIGRRLQTGESRADVEADLVARFGPGIRTMPAMDGIGLIAWIAPPVVGLLGLGTAIWTIGRLTPKRRAPGGPVEGGAECVGAGAVDARIADELAALD